MKRFFLASFLATFFIIFLLPDSAFAIEDPLGLPNNKFGIHILFPDELSEAAALVNSTGGDWGYVTIPIQTGDRNLSKWQQFMDNAGKYHLVPIIRLATEGNYFDTKVWKKPTKEDVLDFANFLDSLEWTVKNRYIVVFNEVNRGDEWEGVLNPAEYAEILNYAVEIFKSLSDDFFIISAGLDNAAPNSADKYMNQYDYMYAMNNAIPGIFSKIDGLASHSYPNPGFRQLPHILTSQSIYSFDFERNLIFRLSGKGLPVFITETGWSKDELFEDQIAQYFKYAFQHVWSDKNVVAVTPFLLRGGQGYFSQFSLTNENGDKNQIYYSLQNMTKAAGKPTIVGNTNQSFDSSSKTIPAKIFPSKAQYKPFSSEKIDVISVLFKWLLKLRI